MEATRGIVSSDPGRLQSMSAGFNPDQTDVTSVTRT